MYLHTPRNKYIYLLCYYLTISHCNNFIVSFFHSYLTIKIYYICNVKFIKRFLCYILLLLSYITQINNTQHVSKVMLTLPSRRLMHEGSQCHAFFIFICLSSLSTIFFKTTIYSKLLFYCSVIYVIKNYYNFNKIKKKSFKLSIGDKLLIMLDILNKHVLVLLFVLVSNLLDLPSIYFYNNASP